MAKDEEFPVERVENYQKGSVSERVVRMIEDHSRHFPDGYVIEVHPEGGIAIGELQRRASS